MKISSFSRVQNKLIGVEKYSIMHSALMTADIFNYYDEDVRNAIIDWAEGKDVTSVVIGKYSVKDIMKDVHCTDFQALCILQATSVNPKSFANAVLMLKRR